MSLLLTDQVRSMEKVSLNKSNKHIHDFLNYMKNERLYTKDTIKNYKLDLQQFAEFLKTQISLLMT